LYYGVLLPFEYLTLNLRFGFRGAQHGLPALTRIIRKERERDEKARGSEKSSRRHGHGRKQHSSDRTAEPACKMNGTGSSEGGIASYFLLRRQ
jgi:hypothetical protein